MIVPITNFQLYRKENASENTTLFTFSFTQHTDPLVGGYYLYKSEDSITYTMCKFRVDDRIQSSEDDQTTSSNGLTYFEYTSDPTDVGKSLYFYIIVVSVISELSVECTPILASVYLSSVSNVIASYNSKHTTITWSGLDTTNGKNSTFSYYRIVKRRCQEVYQPVVFEDESFIFDSGYQLGKYGLVKDIWATSTWFGRITDRGKMYLNDSTLLSNISDASDNYIWKEHNLKMYVEGDTDLLVGTTTNTTYSDMAIEYDSIYIYSVYACNASDEESIKVGYPVTVTNLAELVPTMRSVGNMENTFIRSPYWADLKKSLIGDTYYDKSEFALPYFVNEHYVFKGYLGVANCVINIYINNILSSTTTTDIYGVFKVVLLLPVGNTEIYVTAINSDGDIISHRSNLLQVNTYNIYTNFGVLGQEFKEIESAIQEIQDSIDITKCSYRMFEMKYSPLIDLYKSGSEDETIFKNLAKCIFKAFQNVAFEQGLVDLLDGFKTHLVAIDDYEIIFNHELYRTKQTELSFVSSDTGVVVRDKYYFGVSSIGTAGEESTPSIIKVDTRWWPYGFSSNLIFMWDSMKNAVSYNIYKGTSSTNLGLLCTTQVTYLVENGMGAPNYSHPPKTYNYSGLAKPTNFRNFTNSKVLERKFGFRKGTWIHIIIYMKGTTTLPIYQTDRIQTYVAKLVPPEIRYSIIICNNTTSTVLV